MSFSEKFKTLTGYEPYHWQVALFQRFISGCAPRHLHLPTAAGKTHVMTIWLCAIWHQLETGAQLTIPRRLFFAVDRRVVVDQSEEIASPLIENLKATPLWELLKSQVVSETPIVVSILRGQRVVDYGNVIQDPSLFAIILCTPDMVFSRLLGGAYGDSPRVASREMGLVGQDAFIVLDEAHISEAALEVLGFVEKHRGSVKPFWGMGMSATIRQDADFTLLDDDLSQMSSRLTAPKKLEIVEESTLMETVENVLNNKQWSRAIVYVESPKEAVKLYKKLHTQYDTTLLTGTMRGYEKSKLDFSAFKVPDPLTKTLLISTSAGEVGLDISCDLLITEITTADRLAQRAGRCNRWAECSEATVVVVVPPLKKERREEVEATISYIKALPNISTGALYANPIPLEAFSRTPLFLSLNRASLAQIANTTYPTLKMAHAIRGVETEYQVNLVVRKDEELNRLLALAKTEVDGEDDNPLGLIRVANNEIFKELPKIVFDELLPTNLDIAPGLSIVPKVRVK